MTIHHTAVYLGDNSNAPARLRQHQAFHQNQRGWIDIAYHVSVDRDGNIYELRAPDIVGDTATNYDPAGHFLVVCEGNFDEELISEAQLNGAAHAFAWASQQFTVASDTLGGHRDHSPDTACPGADLYNYLVSGELRRRIDDLIAAGGVDLQKICGPEATAVVAEIEAGTQPPPP
ncbi:N-acetylmuramoyl-L-alanine amidase [Mycobacterium sp. DSM 3803]|nr:N-acetylmuramoyl-L-alanine amidase [Mycobacterium sp. DSM 3803]